MLVYRYYIYRHLQRRALHEKAFAPMHGALLAAGTIWVVAATAESSSAAAAVSAMRDSFHLQRLLVQLELGGAARKKG